MTTNTTTIGDERPTSEEFVGTLTGFDEIAIKKTYGGVELENMGGFTMLRALVFVMHRRDGLDDRAAYDLVMSQPLSEVQARFGDDDADPLGKDAGGKGEQPH